MLFEAMNDAIKEESVGYLFNVEIEVNPEAAEDMATEAPVDGAEVVKAPHGIHAKGLEAPKAPAQLHYSAPSDDGSVQERDQVNEQALETRASRKASDPRGGSKKSKSRRH